MKVDAAPLTRAREHREREIAEVLVRYGLSHLARVVGLERLVAVERSLIGREPRESHTEPENLRLVLEELGPGFIKLGQVLSTPTSVRSCGPPGGRDAASMAAESC